MLLCISSNETIILASSIFFRSLIFLSGKLIEEYSLSKERCLTFFVGSLAVSVWHLIVGLFAISLAFCVDNYTFF